MMNALTTALGIKAGVKAGKKIGSAVKGYLQNNKRRNTEAGKAMDKKYPKGWAQSPTNMTEFNAIKKRIK